MREIRYLGANVVCRLKVLINLVDALMKMYLRLN